MPSLRHRIILNFEGEAEGVNRDEVLQAIIAATPRA
jgi:MoxR-like ATPase